MTYHGGAPRVRRQHNRQAGAESDDSGRFEINGELLLNKVLDAVISAGVAYVISRA